jgi:hypothetical protein
MASIAITIRQIGLAGALAAVAMVTFALGWWQDDIGQVRRPPALAPEVPWNLPKPAAFDLAGYTSILASKPPFGAMAGSASSTADMIAAAASSAVQWRVGGIVLTETARHLIVLIRRPGENTTRAETRQPGEELPDGSILRAIEPTDVTIDRQGTIVRIKMFAQS